MLYTLLVWKTISLIGLLPTQEAYFHSHSIQNYNHNNEVWPQPKEYNNADFFPSFPSPGALKESTWFPIFVSWRGSETVHSNARPGSAKTGSSPGSFREMHNKVWSTSAYKMACLERVKGKLWVSYHHSQHLHQPWEVMSHTCNAHANCKHITNIDSTSPTPNHAQLPHTEFLHCQTHQSVKIWKVLC